LFDAGATRESGVPAPGACAKVTAMASTAAIPDFSTIPWGTFSATISV
jgi:hypothetical protein